MSFIGIVTRKEKDTGVTLEAKIVTPNKKKAARQKFKVRVKKTGLTDYECCVLDQSTVRNKLNTQQDLSSIKNDINFVFNGENGTTIEYVIEDTGVPKLTEFLGADGKIISRPKYGQNDASGYIVMTVKKGVEAITTKIRITIKQTMGQEVLSSAAIKDSSLWNAIKGKNAPWSNNESSSGHKNIFYDLNLITSSDQLLPADRITINSLTDNPIQISWTITDTATNSVITTQRISTEGKIFTPGYQEACSLLNTSVDAVLTGANQYSKRIRIGGLILKATLTLGENTKTITFNCSTCSKYITNKEVIGFAQSKTDIVIGNNIGTKYKYRELTDSNFETIQIPASMAGGELQLGLACGKTALESIAIDELQLEAGDVDYTFRHQICEFRSTDYYSDIDGIFSSTVINNTSIESVIDSSTRWILSINVDKLKQLSISTKKQFTIETTVTATRYTKDGTSEAAGGGEETKLYCHIKLDDSLIPDPSVPSVPSASSV